MYFGRLKDESSSRWLAPGGVPARGSLLASLGDRQLGNAHKKFVGIVKLDMSLLR